VVLAALKAIEVKKVYTGERHVGLQRDPGASGEV
jgi:hypothetical protein